MNETYIKYFITSLYCRSHLFLCRPQFLSNVRADNGDGPMGMHAQEDAVGHGSNGVNVDLAA